MAINNPTETGSFSVIVPKPLTIVAKPKIEADTPPPSDGNGSAQAVTVSDRTSITRQYPSSALPTQSMAFSSPSGSPSVLSGPRLVRDNPPRALIKPNPSASELVRIQGRPAARLARILGHLVTGDTAPKVTLRPQVASASASPPSSPVRVIGAGPKPVLSPKQWLSATTGLVASLHLDMVMDAAQKPGGVTAASHETLQAFKQVMHRISSELTSDQRAKLDAVVAGNSPDSITAASTASLTEVASHIKSSYDLDIVKQFLRDNGDASKITTLLAEAKAENAPLAQYLQTLFVTKASLAPLACVVACDDAMRVFAHSKPTPIAQGAALAAIVLTSMATTCGPADRPAMAEAAGRASRLLHVVALQHERPLSLAHSKPLKQFNAVLDSGRHDLVGLNKKYHEPVFQGLLSLPATKQLVQSWTSTYSADGFQTKLRKAWTDLVMTGVSATPEGQFLKEVMSTRKARWQRMSDATGVPVPQHFDAFRGVTGLPCVRNVVQAWAGGKDVNAAARSLASWSLNQSCSEKSFASDSHAVLYHAAIPIEQTLCDKWLDDSNFVATFFNECEVVSATAADDQIRCAKDQVRVKYKDQWYDYSQRATLIAEWNKDHPGDQIA